MANVTNIQIQPKVNCKPSKLMSSYRGFSSLDQEIEREIAMQWFNSTKGNCFSQRNFLLKKQSA